MRDIREVWGRFETLHGSEYPYWDREDLHAWMGNIQPDWMHISDDALGELLLLACETEEGDAEYDETHGGLVVKQEAPRA